MVLMIMILMISKPFCVLCGFAAKLLCMWAVYLRYSGLGVLTLRLQLIALATAILNPSK